MTIPHFLHASHLKGSRLFALLPLSERSQIAASCVACILVYALDGIAVVRRADFACEHVAVCLDTLLPLHTNDR